VLFLGTIHKKGGRMPKLNDEGIEKVRNEERVSPFSWEGETIPKLNFVKSECQTRHLVAHISRDASM